MKKLKNRISIFMPAFNSETTIDYSLRSINEQKTDKIEKIIIMDDGSTDNTLRIIQEHVRKSRFRYDIIKNKKPSGLAEKYNKIIRSVDTEFILFMHSDVAVKNKNAIQNYFEIMQNPKVVASTSWIRHRREDWEKYSFWQKCEFDRLLDRTHRGMMGKFDIFRVATLRKINGFNSKKYHASGEDWDMSMRLKKEGVVEKSSNIYFHQHSFENNYKFSKLIYRHARYSEAAGVILRNYYRQLNSKQYIFLYFREIMTLGLISALVIYLLAHIIMPLIIVFLVFIVYAFLYTKNTIKSCFRNYIIFVLPFINIIMIFIGNFYTIKGLVTNKQRL